jgi:hypothetical protein
MQTLLSVDGTDAVTPVEYLAIGRQAARNSPSLLWSDIHDGAG